MNRLTADVFEQIVASLRSDGGRRMHEKRNRPRVGLRNTLEIMPCPELGAHEAPPSAVVWVRDVSCEGLGFVCPCPFPTDMQFIAEFDRSGSPKLRVQYRIAYCKPISSGLHSVGARLVNVLADKLTVNFKRTTMKSLS